MEIKKPKSHSPKVHDNTDEHLFLVPPSVLENKLRDFEEYINARGGIGADAALALTLLISIIATDFRPFLNFSGESIRGAFITAFVFMLVKIARDAYLIKKNKKSREDLLVGLHEREK